MFKLYIKSQQAQLDWIRNHPRQWVALNAIIIVGVVGYVVYQDRKLTREMLDEENTQQDS